MLNYQTTSFHDALYIREVLGKRPAPEFELWLQQHHIFDERGRLNQAASQGPFSQVLNQLNKGD